MLRAFATAITVALFAVAVSTSEARADRRLFGAAAGFALGAIIAGAMAQQAQAQSRAVRAPRHAAPRHAVRRRAVVRRPAVASARRAPARAVTQSSDPFANAKPAGPTPVSIRQ
jgi:hypothetical protein